MCICLRDPSTIVKKDGRDLRGLAEVVWDIGGNDGRLSQRQAVHASFDGGWRSRAWSLNDFPVLPAQWLYLPPRR